MMLSELIDCRRQALKKLERLDDKSSFNFGFIDAMRISALRQEIHLGR